MILLDACQRLGVPFHLLTREFYLLVKQHLAPDGVADRRNETLCLDSGHSRTVLPTVDIYPVDEQEGQMIAMVSVAPAGELEMLLRSATALQERYRFRYPFRLGSAASRNEHCARRRTAH